MAEEIYSTLVFFGGLQPDFVMDKMPMYEINLCMRNVHLAHKDSWEQSRMTSFCVIQSQSSKKLKPTDIMKFPWDEASGNNKETSISSDEVKRLKEKSNEFKCRFNGQASS